LLLRTPAGKFVADKLDKMNQDLSGLAEVFFTVPATTCSSSASGWIDTNLQIWKLIEHFCNGGLY